MKISSDAVRARTATIAVAVALPLLALGLYLAYGSPRMPDQPLAARLQDPASDQNLEALVARVEARLREHPEEGEGWDVIAPVYMGWQRYAMRPTPMVRRSGCWENRRSGCRGKARLWCSPITAW